MPSRIDVSVPSRDSQGSDSIAPRIVPGDRKLKKLTIDGVPRLRLIDSHSRQVSVTAQILEYNHRARSQTAPAGSKWPSSFQLCKAPARGERRKIGTVFEDSTVVPALINDGRFSNPMENSHDNES